MFKKYLSLLFFQVEEYSIYLRFFLVNIIICNYIQGISLDMEFDNREEYRIVFWKGSLDNDNMTLFLRDKNGDYEYLHYHR